MISKLIKLMLSDIKLTLKLIHPRRIKNALIFLIFDNGNLSQLYRRYYNIYSGKKLGEAVCSPTEILGSTGKRDIFIFPIIDWDFRYQRPQHIAANLAKQGYRVFYFSVVPLISSGTSNYELTKTSNKLVYLCKLRAYSGLNDDFHRKNMSKLTSDEYRASVSAMMCDLDIVDPVIILNHYYWSPVCSGLPRSTLVYDCMDHHVAFFASARTGIPKVEKELIEKCDCVVTSSTYLYEKVGAIRDNTLIRNGCDADFFSTVPEKTPPQSQPVAGYIGAISEWFDSVLLAEVAKLLPTWRFVLVGSLAGCNVCELRSLPNVELVGEVEYLQLTEYLAQFDVCIIPFKLTELTKATNPVKVYEYLSAGRPVVATPLPELLLLKNLVSIADTPQDFVRQIEHCLNLSKNSEITHMRKAWARHQDWSIRASQFASLIEESITSKRIQSTNFFP